MIARALAGMVVLLVACSTGESVRLPSLPACFEMTASPWDPADHALPRAVRLELASEPFIFKLYGDDPLGSVAVLFFESGDSTTLAWRLSEAGDTLSAWFGVFESYHLTLTPGGEGGLGGELGWEDDAGQSARASVQLDPVGCAER